MIQTSLIQESWALVVPQSEAFARAFYRRLMTNSPALQSLFRDTDFGVQHTAFMIALVKIVDHLENSVILTATLRGLAARHAAAAVKPEHFPPVGAALLATLATFLGPRWTPELSAAWAEAYLVISDLMLAPSAS